MRDLNRINPMITELAKAWHLHPDWRLGQLINNAARRSRWPSEDPFYLDDEQLFKGLKMLNEDRLTVIKGNIV